MKDVEFKNNKSGYSHLKINDKYPLPNPYDYFIYKTGGTHIEGLCTKRETKEWSIEETMSGAPHFTEIVYYNGIDLEPYEIADDKTISYIESSMEIIKPKEFANDKYTLLFYNKYGDKKYFFAIKDEPELTEVLLNSVNKKRVKEKEIKYAVKGIFEKLKNINLIKNNAEIMTTENPIIELAETVQQIYGRNIETRVVSKTGLDHNPIITVEIELPNGKTYRASGSNKKIAKRSAAIQALQEL